jgi:hypothetical protein
MHSPGPLPEADNMHLIRFTDIRLHVARPQSKFPTRPTASKPYIARNHCTYVIEQ